MSASSVLHATTLGIFLVLAAGCASTAPRTEAQSPAPAHDLDTEGAGMESAANAADVAPHDYDWTMPDSKPRAAKSEAPAANLRPSQATDGKSVLKSVE